MKMLTKTSKQCQTCSQLGDLQVTKQDPDEHAEQKARTDSSQASSRTRMMHRRTQSCRPCKLMPAGTTCCVVHPLIFVSFHRQASEQLAIAQACICTQSRLDNNTACAAARASLASDDACACAPARQACWKASSCSRRPRHSWRRCAEAGLLRACLWGAERNERGWGRDDAASGKSSNDCQWLHCC